MTCLNRKEISERASEDPKDGPGAKDYFVSVTSDDFFASGPLQPQIVAAEKRATASTISHVRTMKRSSRKWLPGQNFGF